MGQGSPPVPPSLPFPHTALKHTDLPPGPPQPAACLPGWFTPGSLRSVAWVSSLTPVPTGLAPTLGSPAPVRCMLLPLSAACGVVDHAELTLRSAGQAGVPRWSRPGRSASSAGGEKTRQTPWPPLSPPTTPLGPGAALASLLPAVCFYPSGSLPSIFLPPHLPGAGGSHKVVVSASTLNSSHPT